MERVVTCVMVWSAVKLPVIRTSPNTVKLPVITDEPVISIVPSELLMLPSAIIVVPGPI